MTTFDNWLVEAGLNELTQFHFLRPSWLLLIPSAVIVCILLWRFSRSQNNWQDHINPDLLPYLLEGKSSVQKQWPFIGLFIGLVLASLAMAGPAWQKLPQPVHKTESALVIMLDLSPSMMAQDTKPSRLVRARLKLIDLLKQRQEGLTALIAYSGEAHVVTPLTDDTDTISSLVPSLSPQIMPLRGSNAEMALDQALTLLKDAGLTQGDLLLVTDGLAPEAADYIEAQLPAQFRLSILGIGTTDGAPIPVGNGGFAKDNSGGIVISKLDERPLMQLAASFSGGYSKLTADDSDINRILLTPKDLERQTRELNREFDLWQDTGPWLALLLLPFALVAFRRGWIVSVAFCVLLFPSEQTLAQDLSSANTASAISSEEKNNAQFEASAWQDLWRTRDQQGQVLLNQGNTAAAAQAFENHNQKAAAHYNSGDYEQAAKHFEQDDSATGHYNRGNALAKAGDLDNAAKAYQEALKQQTDFSQAQDNLELVEALKKQQEQQKQSGDNQQSQDGDQQNEQKPGQQGENQQNQDQQDGEQSSEQQSQQSSKEQNGSQQPSDSNSESSDAEDKNQAQESEQQNAQSSDEQEAQQTQAMEPSEEAADKEGNEQAAIPSQPELTEEQRQSMEQWLRQVPDDPSGLMRRKFEYQYHQRKEEYRAGTWQPPENDANKRW